MDIGTGIPIGSLILVGGAFALRFLQSKNNNNKELEKLKERVVFKDTYEAKQELTDNKFKNIEDDISEIKVDVRDILNIIRTPK